VRALERDRAPKAGEKEIREPYQPPQLIKHEPLVKITGVILSFDDV
jgi:hypothetical protein